MKLVAKRGKRRAALSVRLPVQLHKDAVVASEALGLSLNEMICLGLREYLDRARRDETLRQNASTLKEVFSFRNRKSD